MNKNTKRYKKLGFTNNPETTLGCGERRTFGTRPSNPIFKGVACNTARPYGKNKWVGAVKAEKTLGQGKYSE